MRYVEVQLTFQRLAKNKILGFAGNKILVRVLIGPCLWRLWIVPEEENFSPLLSAVAEIDRDLSDKFDYFEGPFLPEIIRKVESIRRGIRQILAEKAP